MQSRVPARFDVVVVGAGPAGSTAAYALAREGFRVLLLERGKSPGSKCASGCHVFTALLNQIYPNFEKEAPIQRWVRKEWMSVVRGGDMLTIEFASDRASSFTCFLPQLASWMSTKAEEAGAVVVTEVPVDGFVVDDGRVKGVIAGPDRVEAELVIDAEGVNRLLLERAGFIGRLRPEQVSVAVKETVRLSEREIEDRFALDNGAGLSWVLLGTVTERVPGGCFIYTNKDSLSLGLVVVVKHATETLEKPLFNLIEDFRLHPRLRTYLKGGKVVEYAAHLIPEASIRMMPKLYRDGLLVVGDAAGMALSTGYAFRGVDFAAYSGFLAAKAAKMAHEDGGFDEGRLSIYQRLLEDSLIMKQLRKFRGVYDILNDRFTFHEFPDIVVGVAERAFAWEKEAPTIWEAIKKSKDGVGWLRLLVKLYRMVRFL